MPDAIRIDRWLWAVRLYKTRAQATAACRLNQVTIDGQFAKPARPVTIDNTVQINKDHMTQTLKVLGLTEKRIGARLVPEFISDQTPAEELERASATREQARLNRVFQVSGEGRPSKRRRREIDKFLQEVEKASDAPD